MKTINELINVDDSDGRITLKDHTHIKGISIPCSTILCEWMAYRLIDNKLDNKQLDDITEMLNNGRSHLIPNKLLNEPSDKTCHICGSKIYVTDNDIGYCVNPYCMSSTPMTRLRWIINTITSNCFWYPDGEIIDNLCNETINYTIGTGCFDLNNIIDHIHRLILRESIAINYDRITPMRIALILCGGPRYTIHTLLNVISITSNVDYDNEIYGKYIRFIDMYIDISSVLNKLRSTVFQSIK